MKYAIAVLCLLLSTGLLHEAKADFKAAVKAIVEEAEKSLAEKDEWPRKEPNFIADNGIELKPKDILSKCAAVLDKRPAMDAYIKFQLLGSIEDDKAFLNRSFGRVMGKLPPLLHPPRFSLTTKLSPNYEKLNKLVNSGNLKEKPGRLDRIIYRGSITNLKKVSAPHIPIIKELSDDFFAAREMAEKANQPNYALRELLTSRLPDGSGLRLAFVCKDVSDRLAAFDVTYRDRGDVLMGDIQTFSTAPELNQAGRRTVAAQMRKLGGVGHGTMIKNITVEATGEVLVEDVKIYWPPSYTNAASSWLNGRDPAVAPKSWSELDREDDEDDDD